MVQIKTPQFRSVEEIVKFISKQLIFLFRSSPYRSSDVMEHYLSLLLIYYRSLPRQLHYIHKYGGVSKEDAPYNKTYMIDLQKEYGKSYPYLNAAVMAFILAGDRCGHIEGVLFDDKHENWDILGLIYEELAQTNTHNGMHFTPWSLCQLLAEVNSTGMYPDYTVVHDISHHLSGRVSPEKIQEELLKKAASEQLLIWIDEARKNGFKPLKSHDPCAGSGRTLIAYASMHSRLAEALGLYQYYLQDIDYKVCMMAEINMAKFCMGGWLVRQQALSFSGFYETSRWMKYESIEGFNGAKRLSADDKRWVEAQTLAKLNDPIYKMARVLQEMSQPLHNNVVGGEYACL